jgi:adenosylcobinamide-GDP ribazoletransferase
MKPLLVAIQFLTIFPVSSHYQAGEKELRQSVICFPIVGLILGGVLAVLDYGVCRLFPPLPASVAIVILMLAVSGCFHMDGLADTADGFLSSRPRDRILEIMRDSRVGPMGVIAIVCVLALKISALASVPGSLHWRVVLLMPLAGRCTLVLGMKAVPYARAQGGLVSVFGRPGWPSLITAISILSAAAWLALGIPGLAIAGVVLLMTILFSFWCRRKIGGFTGDTLGAACEIAEILPALICASWGWRV